MFKFVPVHDISNSRGFNYYFANICSLGNLIIFSNISNPMKAFISSTLRSFRALECGLLEVFACAHLFVSVISRSHTSSVKNLVKKSKAAVLSVKCIVGLRVFVY